MLTNIECQILNTILKTEKGYRPSEIKKICNLTEPTLHKYLNKLHDEEKYLLKKSYTNKSSHNAYYCINNNIEIFKKLFDEFIGTLYWLEFHSSAYCQNMITLEYVRNIKSKWNYPNDELIKKSYLEVFEDYQPVFSWDDPENNSKLIEYLGKTGISFSKTPRIEKGDNNTIIISDGKKNISLILNDEKTEVKIDDGIITDTTGNRITYKSEPKLFARMENGKLNLYRREKKLEITKEKCIEMANEHIKGLSYYVYGTNLPNPYISDEELLFILKSSPSAFKFALTDVLSQPTDAELSRIREDISLFALCVFCWENVPGKDTIRIINFLEDVGVDWVKNAKIEKSSDNKVITISDGKNVLPFELNEEKNKVKINKKKYILYSKEVKKGCTVVSFLYADPDTLGKNSLIEIWNQLPDFRKERYFSPIKRLIPNNIFSEQIILNFISDVRLGHFVAQPLYSTGLEVCLNVRMSLNGQEKICKDISYKTSLSY